MPAAVSLRETALDPQFDIRYSACMDNAKYRTAIESLRETLANHRGGWDNAEGRSAISRCLMDIKVAAGDMSLDGYFLEVINKLERHVGELYSPRKHLKYRVGSRSGADELTSRINSGLNRLDRLPLNVIASPPEAP